MTVWLPPVGTIVLLLCGLIVLRWHPKIAIALVVVGMLALWISATPVVAHWELRALEVGVPQTPLTGTGARAIVVLGGGSYIEAPEYGADTVSRFIAARCLDRLHVTVAPVMLGAGGPGIDLPPLDRADQAQRMPVRLHKIEDDVLFDCDLSAQRVTLGVAKKST